MAAPFDLFMNHCKDLFSRKTRPSYYRPAPHVHIILPPADELPKYFDYVDVTARHWQGLALSLEEWKDVSSTLQEGLRRGNIGLKNLAVEDYPETVLVLPTSCAEDIRSADSRFHACGWHGKRDSLNSRETETFVCSLSQESRAKDPMKPDRHNRVRVKYCVEDGVQVDGPLPIRSTVETTAGF
jgi:hypothetical protein